MKKIALILTVAIALASCNSSKNVVATPAAGSSTYWQQHVNYDMDVDMDVDRYQYTGRQKLVYT
ncbi:MAG: hypothetical protein ACI90Q_000376, partial [Nonlabens sp.]